MYILLSWIEPTYTPPHTDIHTCICIYTHIHTYNIGVPSPIFIISIFIHVKEIFRYESRR